MERIMGTKDIAPAKGGKYSPNLYKWLTQRDKKHRAETSKVFSAPDGGLWIGMLDDDIFLIGCRLMTVLCSGTKAKSMAYPLKQIGPLEEVPDFWARYLEVGRCAIDQEHTMFFVGDETRWLVDGEKRECMWCGKAKQRRETYQVPRTRWIEA
jgi:hypothetical protein